MVQRIVSKATVDSSDEDEGNGSRLSDNAEISGSVATSSSSDRSEDDDGQAVDKIHTRKKVKGKKKKKGTSGCFPSIYECFLNLFSRE